MDIFQQSEKQSTISWSNLMPQAQKVISVSPFSRSCVGLRTVNKYQMHLVTQGLNKNVIHSSKAGAAFLYE